jgi:maltodextrin utilization protein YvdJ
VSINGGKVIMMVLVIVIAANFSLTWTFVLAAGASILLNLIKPDGFHRVRKA